MARATYKLRIDWDDDGSFATSGDDITALWLWGRGLSAARGRDRASQLTGRSTAGRLSCALDNSDDRFSSFNTGSSLAGKVLPGRKVQLLATFDGTDYELWGGFLDLISPTPAVKGPKIAGLNASGPLAWLNDPRRTVSVAMQTSIATGDAVDALLDAANWPAGDRAVDAGQTTMARWWQGKASPLTGLRKIEDTEGGFLAEGGDRKVRFEDRHHRLTSPHTVSQATYSDQAGATLNYSDIRQVDPWGEIYNRFEARVQRYTVGSLAVLWTLAQSGADSPSIPAGESQAFWAGYPNPQSAPEAFGVDAWTTPVATTDYTANSAADGSGTDLTGSVSVAVSKLGNDMRVTLTNGAAVPAYITFLRARGTPVTADDPVTIRAENSASQDLYGVRTYPSPAEFVPDIAEADGWARANLAVYKDPVPWLQVTLFGNVSDAHMEECLTRDISDRVTVVATGDAGLGINGDFFVEAIEHRITSGLHYTTITLSPADAFGGVIVLDVGPGLDTGRLGY